MANTCRFCRGWWVEDYLREYLRAAVFYAELSRETVPQRSNDFQRLVYLVKTHVAAGATVTESKLLPDWIAGTKREVASASRP